MGINRIIENNSKLKRLLEDLSDATNSYPGLTIRYNDGWPISLNGNFILRDNNNIEQGDWDILIKIPRNYPNGFPELFELSSKIERSEDTHIDSDGKVCLELDIIADHIAKTKGIKITEFINDYVIRYFCWILLFNNGYSQKLDYWGHGVNGIQQFFYEILNTQDINFVLYCLDIVLKNKLPGRNQDCFCGKKEKYKKCHIVNIEELTKYRREELSKYSEHLRVMALYRLDENF